MPSRHAHPHVSAFKDITSLWYNELSRAPRARINEPSEIIKSVSSRRDARAQVRARTFHASTRVHVSNPNFFLYLSLVFSSFLFSFAVPRYHPTKQLLTTSAITTISSTYPDWKYYRIRWKCTWRENSFFIIVVVSSHACRHKYALFYVTLSIYVYI